MDFTLANDRACLRVLGFAAVFGAALLCPQASHAQQDHQNEVLDVLRGALKCALPPERTVQGPSDHTVQSYTGDARTVAVAGRTLTFSRSGVEERKFTGTAKVSDIEAVRILHLDSNSSSLKLGTTHDSVRLLCFGNRDCFQKTEQDAFYIDPNCLHAGCPVRPGFHPDPQKFVSEYYDIRLCDQETARLAKLAIEELIKINPATAAPPESAPSPNPPKR